MDEQQTLESKDINTKILETPLPPKNNKMVYILGAVCAIVLLVTLLTGIVLVANQYDSHNLSSSFSSSVSSLSSSESSVAQTQNYTLRTKLLNSAEYSSTLMNLSVNQASDVTIFFQDQLAIVLQKGNDYLVIQSSPESTGTTYEDKLVTTPVSASNLSGTVNRIPLSDVAAISTYKQRFSLPNISNWSYYTNTYAEQGCGQIFDPSTDSYSTAPACGNSVVHVQQGSLSAAVSIYCVSVGNSTSFCDQTIADLAINLL